jgi:hypothetical protein
MNFNDATDRLFDRISHEELAEALGVSVASIRQARLRADARAYRAPPQGWEEAALRLAERQRAHFERLVGSIQRSLQKSNKA